MGTHFLWSIRPYSAYGHVFNTNITYTLDKYSNIDYNYYMKIVSWNINGIRSLLRKAGVVSFENSHVVLLQEVRAPVSVLRESEHSLGNSHNWYWHPAERPGYSGVGIGISKDFYDGDVEVRISGLDTEGRILTVILGNLAIISAYMPSRTRNGSRDSAVNFYCSMLTKHINDLNTAGYSMIAGGDLNIQPQELDSLNLPLISTNSSNIPTYKDRVLDYVMLSKDLLKHEINCELLDTELSDHNPVITTID